MDNNLENNLARLIVGIIGFILLIIIIYLTAMWFNWKLVILFVLWSGITEFNRSLKEHFKG